MNIMPSGYSQLKKHYGNDACCGGTGNIQLTAAYVVQLQNNNM